jgi:heme/copper-type cytochrome/quinol oxidase subunit 3
LDCLLLFFIALHRWFYDIIIEATFEGKHTKKVRQGIKLGMALFILSEIMFFCSFFCSFFYYYFSSSMWGGGNFPSPSLYKLSPWGLPLLNTVLLLSSGVSLTLGHKSILLQKKSEFKDSLCFTIFYGFLFLSIQLFEYKNTVLSINDSVYGSIFYLTTGFHGIHVLVGAIFLVICLLRFLRKHFVMGQHVGFECSV